MLAVVDYGAGNLRSVLHALNHLGAKNVKLVHEPDDLTNVNQIILPGVGAFGAGMQQLQKQNLIDPLKDAIMAGMPYLGICLGMQFLFEHSDEMGNHAGFGILPGYVTRFSSEIQLKIPHMGWNQLIPRRESALLAGISPDSYAYFVHSYYCVPGDENDVLVETDYGIRFTAGIARNNIFGVQFHPEKSQVVGLKLLSNFLKITEKVS